MTLNNAFKKCASPDDQKKLNHILWLNSKENIFMNWIYILFCIVICQHCNFVQISKYVNNSSTNRIIALDVSKISSSHWIFNMKSDSGGDIHLAHIWKKNQNSRAYNLWTHRRFVLVWAGLARAVGWKTMAMRS